MTSTFSSAKNMLRSKRGFTLIELVITIAILGILAAIVIPSYSAQMRKTRRGDAITTLLEISQELERCRSDNNAYTVAAGCTNFNNTASDQGFYTITTVQNAMDFLLTAEPVAGSPQAKDDQCARYTLDQTGLKKSHPKSGGAIDTDTDTRNDCW
jgi:type IV pilus assembly protein PilE